MNVNVVGENGYHVNVVGPLSIFQVEACRIQTHIFFIWFNDYMFPSEQNEEFVYEWELV